MVARCIHTEAFGSQGNIWQCLLPDPHPDQGHQFPIDATHYGLQLENRSAPWLASELRMAHQKVRFEQGRAEAATRVAINLAATLAQAMKGRGVSLNDHRLVESLEFIRKNAPDTAESLGIAV
jgi:hypothetical protein